METGGWHELAICARESCLALVAHPTATFGSIFMVGREDWHGGLRRHARASWIMSISPRQVYIPEGMRRHDGGQSRMSQALCRLV